MKRMTLDGGGAGADVIEDNDTVYQSDLQMYKGSEADIDNIFHKNKLAKSSSHMGADLQSGGFPFQKRNLAGTIHDKMNENSVSQSDLDRTVMGQGNDNDIASVVNGASLRQSVGTNKDMVMFRVTDPMNNEANKLFGPESESREDQNVDIKSNTSSLMEKGTD